MTERLPLFPLGTVLFPGLLLPLHIFEDRYRRLVRDLVAGPEDRRRFGVVAIRQGREVGAHGATALHDVGCTAELTQVQPYDDGRFDLVTTGSTRFHVLALDESLPYLQADVKLLDEPAGDTAEVLTAGVAKLFTAYRDALLAAGGQQADEPPRLPGDPLVLSYLVAAAMLLDLEDKQQLLAAPDTTARLRAELPLLRREVTLLRVLPSVPAVDLVRSAYPPS